MQETWVPPLNLEYPLEKEVAAHSSVLAWKIPWTKKPGGLQPVGCKESDTTERLSMQAHSVYAAKIHMVNSVVKSAALNFH